MGRKSKRGKKLIEILKTARKQRGTARKFDGFDKDSPWRQKNLCSTRLRSRKTKCIEVDTAEYSRNRKEGNQSQKRKAKNKDDNANITRKRETPTGLAVRRTQAIGALQYRLSVAGTVRENEISNIASTFNIGSGRTLRRHYQNFRDGTGEGFIEDQNKSGRPVQVTSKENQAKFLQFLASRKYHVTVRTVECWLRKERGTGSKDSALKLMNSVGCRRVRVNIKPKLTQNQLQSRFIYCLERLEEVKNFMMTGKSKWDIEVFVDEKWFNKLTIGSYLWLPENVSMEDASEYWRHKSHIPKVMYFAAVSKPVPEFNFDGRIVFMPLVKEVKAKRNSSVRPAGTVMLQTTTMDRTKFNEAIIEVINSITNSLPTAKRIRIIADGAGGHSVGKTGQNGLERSLRDVRNWINENSNQGGMLENYDFEFLLQPAQSPDLNMLDIGAWWSLETAVNDLRYDPNWSQRGLKTSDLLRELNETVMNAWHSWDTKHVLSKLQGTLFSNYWSVLSSKGSNSYDKRAATKAPTVSELSAHLEKAKSRPFWSESISILKSV